MVYMLKPCNRLITRGLQVFQSPALVGGLFTTGATTEKGKDWAEEWGKEKTPAQGVLCNQQ